MTISIKEVKAQEKKWKNNTHKLEIGFDDWYASYEDVFKGQDNIISCHQDIVNILIEHNLNSMQTGELLMVAWQRGCIDPAYHFPNPKKSMRVGAGKYAALAIQKSTAKLKIEEKEYTFQPYIGPMNFGGGNDQSGNVPPTENVKESDQIKYVTHIDNVEFYIDILTPQGIEHVKAYLAVKIVTEIENRLTQLKVAGADYKAEAKTLKKQIDRIVKELE